MFLSEFILKSKLFFILIGVFVCVNILKISLVEAESGANLRNDEVDRCNRTIDIHHAVSSPRVTNLNRGKPLHCTYRIRIRPVRDDWIVFLRFTKFKVGELSEDRQRCIGGYVQIVDGYRDSNYSNREHSGYYCGEIDMPKTFISETPYVKIVFRADSYNYDTFIQFDATVEKQPEFLERYGQYHKYYPHRRGVPVPGTYCERTFTDCSPGPRCYVQSPGYPGIYSRNLRCRYHLSVRQSLVGLELSAFDVDGQACDNLLMCFPRPVSTKENECMFDYVRIYDGPDENSPVIVTLCGRGRLKSSIISSTSNILVEFVSSPAGPFLSTGFHFKADAIIDTGNSESIQYKNGTCIIERMLTDANAANLFTNIRSWYPANTTCTYKFIASDDKNLISIEFLWFRIERVTLCQESLRLFDGSEAEMSTLMTRLCDMNKPQSGSSKNTYITSGPALVVQFSSLFGSLDGSSLNYGFDVRLIPPQNDQELNEISNSCSKFITPESLTSGSVTWNQEDFNKTQSNPIVCNITFDASSIQHGRVNISMYSPFTATNCDECNDLHQGKIMIYRNIDVTHPFHSLCYCKLSRASDISHVVSTGSQMNVSLQLPLEWAQQQHHASPIQVIYRFFSDTRCGPNEILTPQLQGSLHFPFKDDSNPDKEVIKPPYRTQTNSLSYEALREPVFCNWKLPLFPQLDVAFNVEYLNLMANCSTDFLILKDMKICLHGAFTPATHSKTRPQENHRRDIIIKSDEMTSGHETLSRNGFSTNVVTIYYGSSNPINSSFTLLYTQLKLLPMMENMGEQLVPMGRNCEFLCSNPPACLSRELVCNGVINCPGIINKSGSRIGEDEDESICKAGNHWISILKQPNTLLALAAACFIALCFSAFMLFCVCRSVRKKRHRF